MDERFWRAESRRLRAEADYLAGLADDLETAAREAMGAPAIEEVPPTPSASRLAFWLIVALLAASLGALVYFAFTR